MPQDFVAGPGHFASGRPGLGEGVLSVAVGPVSVRFDGLPGRWLGELTERYTPFLHGGQPLHRVAVQLGEAAYLQPSADGFLRVEESTHAEGEVLLSLDFAGFRPAAGDGVLRVSRPESLEHISGALENYLRWVVADLALARSGFVLHSAGLVRGGRAYLFFGHSGAGKSTVCGLSEGATLLSDDLVLVMRSWDGFGACTTPFRGTLAQGAKARGQFPVAGAFRLRQSTGVKVAPVPLGLAVGMVLSCCPFVSDPSKRSEMLLPTVEAFCSAVPVRELFFRKEPSFWGVVAEPEESP